MAFTKLTTDLNNHQSQPNKPTISATQLKILYDKAPNDIKTSHNALIDELESSTNGSSGADSVGCTEAITGGGTTVQGNLEALQQAIADVQSGAVANDSLTEAKMADEMKKDIVGGVTAYDTYTTHLADNASFFEQAKGFYSNSCAWHGNTKLVAMFQPEEPWAGTNLVVDSINVKLGVRSLSLIKADNLASGVGAVADNLNIDLTKLANGESSPDTDYINIVFYISDVTKVDSSIGVVLSLGANTVFNPDNRYRVLITQGLVTGWNYAKIRKVNFTKLGVVDWSSIKSLQIFWQSTINAQSAYVSFQLVQLVKKDPLSAYPNPFQRFGVRDFAINSGEWFVGLEDGEIIWRNLNPSTITAALAGAKIYKDCIIAVIQKIKTVNQSAIFSWYRDINNRIDVYIGTGVMYVQEHSGGVSTHSSAAYPCVVGDNLRFVFAKTGTSVSLQVYKNNGTVPLILTKSITVSGDGYLAIGGITSAPTTILSASITTTEHASHADVAEVALSAPNSMNGNKVYGNATYTDMFTASQVLTKSIPIGTGYKNGIMTIRNFVNNFGIVVFFGTNNLRTLICSGGNGAWSRRDRGGVTVSNSGWGIAGIGININDLYINGSNIDIVFRNDDTNSRQLTCIVDWEVW